VAPFTLKSIIGPNGAGKTTFFNLLSGQYRPTAGRILFKGRDITRRGAAARTRLGIGRSFQLTNIFPTLSVLENVRLAVQAHRGLGFTAWRDYRRFPDLEDVAYRLLETVLLEGKWHAAAGALAHGEKRKLELGILLALEPEVLLLDEPTNGVDPVSRRELWALLHEFVEGGMAVVISTPYMDEAERCHRVGLVHRGRLLLEGAPEKLLAAYQAEGHPHPAFEELFIHEIEGAAA